MTTNGLSLMEVNAQRWAKVNGEGEDVCRPDKADYEIQRMAQELSGLTKEINTLNVRRMELLNRITELKGKMDKIITEYKVPEFLAKNVKSKPKGLSLKDAEKELAKLSPEAQKRFWDSVRAKNAEKSK